MVKPTREQPVSLRWPAKKLALTALFASLTAVGAQISIRAPFSPVPFTLQTACVLLAGFILGPGSGAVSQIVYLLLGISGLPVFAGFRGGIQVLTEVTGGFLIAFPFMAWIAGAVAGKIQASWRRLFAGALLGELVLYSLGVSWFCLFTARLPGEGIMLACVPFLPADILKITLVILLVKRLRAHISLPLP